MKFVLTLALFIAGSWAKAARPEFMEIASYVILSNEEDDQLKQQHASKFTFKIDEDASSQTTQIRYSINDGDDKLVPTAKSETTIIENVNPGKHDFKFVLNLNHYEIIINDLEILEGHHMTIQLNFKRSDRIIQMKKPVIYLYPETETEIDIEVAATGTLSFTYPEYNNGWHVTADSLGNISCNGEDLNYLFWESEQEFDGSNLNSDEGFYVNGANIVSFLETSLKQFGFTSKERADFITYWAPQMKDVTNLYIYFLFNENCDQFATLNISPEPAQTARFYMLWADAGSDYDDIGLVPQDIPSITRDGFTVLEWGGAEISTVSETTN